MRNTAFLRWTEGKQLGCKSQCLHLCLCLAPSLSCIFMKALGAGGGIVGEDILMQSKSLIQQTGPGWLVLESDVGILPATSLLLKECKIFSGV